MVAERRRLFELFLRSAGQVLARNHGTEHADEVLDAARSEYRRVLPEVPDIGGLSNVFQPVMTANGGIVALHRAMQARGHTAADSVRVCQEVTEGWLRRLPGFVLRALGRLLLSPPARWYFESQARRSQARRHAEDFVWRVEQGPDGEMAMVFDECAVNKWYDAQGLQELKPYCNFVDVTYSRLMGMGIDASQTIGLGCDHCALRFRHGRETVIPQNLREIIPGGDDRARAS